MDVLSEIRALEKIIQRNKYTDVKTKYKVKSLFRAIEDLIKYRQVMPPIKENDSGTIFTCVRCNQTWTTEGTEFTVDDFLFCPACGQKFRKEVREDE